jgi:hypothetical protein
MSGSSPDIRNNIVFCVAGVQQIGFWEQTTNHPAFFNNNDVFACPTALYYLNGDGYQNNFTDMNASFTWCSGNDCVDPLFASTNGPDGNCQDVLDNDWRLTVSSPASVKTGGLDLGALFTVDRDNVTRTGDGTTGWSIGAYEY